MRLTSVALSSMMALSALAQNSAFSAVADHNVWLSGHNVAALPLSADSTASIATVEWGGAFGPWHDFSDADIRLELLADVRSYVRFTPSVMSYGNVSYLNSTDYRSQGSMLFDDGSLKPFDIYSDTTCYAGNRHTELINVDGAIACQLSPHLSIGASVDYRAGTYVRYKDLRHTNSYMRLDALAGVCLPALFDGHLDVGADARFRRRSESVEFKTYGTSDIVYRSLVDYAVFTGVVESFGSEGFTDSGRKLPLLSQYFGAGVQLCLHLGNFDFYNDFSRIAGSGFYGRQSQFSISYAQWDVVECEYLSRLQWHSLASRHSLAVDVNSQHLTAKRKVYRKETADNNASLIYYRYYTPVKMNDKSLLNVDVNYSASLAPLSGIYQWQVDAALSILQSDQTANLYPLYASQLITVYEPSLGVTRRFLLNGNRVFSLHLGASVSKGNGDEYNQKVIPGVNYDNLAVKVQSHYLHHNYEYLTDLQYGGHVAFDYSWPWPSMTSLRPCVSLSYDVDVAASPLYVDGKYRNMVKVSVQCEF